jgi:hypothetical protein
MIVQQYSQLSRDKCTRVFVRKLLVMADKGMVSSVSITRSRDLCAVTCSVTVFTCAQREVQRQPAEQS